MTIENATFDKGVDGTFIGGGHNALVAANYLGRARTCVLVLYNSYVPGYLPILDVPYIYIIVTRKCIPAARLPVSRATIIAQDLIYLAAIS